MAEPKRHFIDGEHGQIHLRMAAPENPTQPPLDCLHMSPKSGRQFETFMRAASNDRIVVASDYPGYGESAPPPAEPHVSIADYARSVWRVADALGHTKVDLSAITPARKSPPRWLLSRRDASTRSSWFPQPSLPMQSAPSLTTSSRPFRWVKKEPASRSCGSGSTLQGPRHDAGDDVGLHGGKPAGR